jgi:hypothetical protein
MQAARAPLASPETRRSRLIALKYRCKNLSSKTRIGCAPNHPVVHLPFRAGMLICNLQLWSITMLRILAVSAIGLMISLAVVSSALAVVTPP